MTSLASETNGTEASDERTLFEKAQAKLNEAFSLLQTLELELQKAEQRRQAQSSVHDKHASERAELLAYVERVHAEAVELASKPVRVSREGRDHVRRVTMRIEEVTRALQSELPVELTPAGKRLPRDTASNEDGMAAHLSRIAAATQIITPPPVPAELAEYYDDEVTPFLPMTKRDTVLADPLVPRAVGVSRKPQNRAVMFDPSERDAELEAQVEENTAHLQRERHGAQMRRDRAPTEKDHSARKPTNRFSKAQLAWITVLVCFSIAAWLVLIGLRS